MCEIEIVVRSAPSEQLGDVPVKQYGDMQRVWYVVPSGFRVLGIVGALGVTFQ
jgi:hypothetical protein